MDEQTNRRPRIAKWIVWAVLGVTAGLALGFAIGWRFWPVEYTNTAPDVLRRDYRDDYIVMVATAYQVNAYQVDAYQVNAYQVNTGGVEQARGRLELLDPQDPATPGSEPAERIIAAGGRAGDITRLARLAWALGSLPPTLSPYLEGQP